MTGRRQYQSIGFLAAMGLFLASCGGADRSASTPQRIASVPAGVVPFAEGPISNACRIQDRRQASRSRCGCIQAAANLTLSQSQQQRSLTYFNDPGRLQDVRQSDAPSNERFWTDWKQFAETAETMCRNS